MPVSICFIFLGAYIECVYVNEFNILFLYSSYYYYITSFFVFCFTLFLKKVFWSDICIITHAFFCLFMSQFIEVNRDGRWWITNGRYKDNYYGFPSDTSGKEPTANAGDIRDRASIPGLGGSPRGENGNPPQYSCVANPMDKVTWRGMVNGVAKSQTWLKRLRTHTHARTIII